MGWGDELGLKLREEGMGGAADEWVAPVQVDKDTKGMAFMALQSHKLAKRAKVLDDDGAFLPAYRVLLLTRGVEWKKIEGTLVEFMQAEKAKREDGERKKNARNNVDIA